MKYHYLLLATTTSGPEATTSQSFTVTRASNLAAKLGRYSLQFISPLPATYIKATIPCFAISLAPTEKIHYYFLKGTCNSEA